MEVNQKMWKWLIGHGKIISSESYYGDISDYEGTILLRDSLANQSVSIDWVRTGEVTDGSDHRFRGTFCDEQDNLEYFKGILYLEGEEDGKLIKTIIDEDTSIIDMIKEVMAYAEI